MCHHYNGRRSKLRFTQYRGELMIDPMQCRLTKHMFCELMIAVLSYWLNKQIFVTSY